jgi:hypothetical protein
MPTGRRCVFMPKSASFAVVSELKRTAKVKKRIMRVRELKAIAERSGYKFSEDALEVMLDIYYRQALSYHPDRMLEGFSEFSFSEYIEGYDLKVLLSDILFRAGKIKKRCKRENIGAKLIGSIKRKLKIRVPKYLSYNYFFRDESDSFREDNKLTFCAEMYIFLKDLGDRRYSRVKKYLAEAINDLLSEESTDIITRSAVILRMCSSGCGRVVQRAIKSTKSMDFCRMNILRSLKCAIQYEGGLEEAGKLILSRGTDLDKSYLSLYKRLLVKWTQHGLSPLKYFCFVEFLINGCVYSESNSKFPKSEIEDHPQGLTRIISSEMKKEGRHFGPDEIYVAVTSYLALNASDSKECFKLTTEVYDRFYRCILYYEICENSKSFAIFDEATALFEKEHSSMTGARYLELIPEAVELRFKTGKLEEGRELIKILNGSDGVIKETACMHSIYHKMAEVCALSGEKEYFCSAADKLALIMKENEPHLRKKESVAIVKHHIALRKYGKLMKYLAENTYPDTIITAILGSLAAGNTDFAGDVFYRFPNIYGKQNDYEHREYLLHIVKRIADSYYLRGDIYKCYLTVTEGIMRTEKIFKDSNCFGKDDIMFNYPCFRSKRKKMLEPFKDMQNNYGFAGRGELTEDILASSYDYNILAKVCEDDLEIAEFIIKNCSGAVTNSSSMEDPETKEVFNGE